MPLTGDFETTAGMFSAIIPRAAREFVIFVGIPPVRRDPTPASACPALERNSEQLRLPLRFFSFRALPLKIHRRIFACYFCFSIPICCFRRLHGSCGMFYVWLQTVTPRGRSCKRAKVVLIGHERYQSQFTELVRSTGFRQIRIPAVSTSSKRGTGRRFGDFGRF